MARPTGFEPVTVALEVRCSIQLSYGRMWPSLLDEVDSSYWAGSSIFADECLRAGSKRWTPRPCRWPGTPVAGAKPRDQPGLGACATECDSVSTARIRASSVAPNPRVPSKERHRQACDALPSAKSPALDGLRLFRFRSRPQRPPRRHRPSMRRLSSRHPCLVAAPITPIGLPRTP